MTDKDREEAIAVWDIAQRGWTTYGDDIALIREHIVRIRAEAAREERERFSEAVRIIATAWTADHKDWREFDAGYTSALELIKGMLLATKPASENGEQ